MLLEYSGEDLALDRSALRQSIRQPEQPRDGILPV